MADVLLTKRVEFAAAHRYHREAWDFDTNRRVFGACNNSPGHGHNYLLDVTVAGQVDAHTGMVVNLFDLKIVLQRVLEEFDHKHLNLDTPYFSKTVPTAENIATLLWTKLKEHRAIGQVEHIRLYEDEDLWADVSAADEQTGRASLTRRYHFSAASPWGRPASQAPGHTGHNFVLEVMVEGAIHPDTGMVTDLTALDRAVRELVIRRFSDQTLREDPDLATRPFSGESFARFIWTLLVKAVPAGRLQLIRLAESDDRAYEYAEG